MDKRGQCVYRGETILGKWKNQNKGVPDPLFKVQTSSKSDDSGIEVIGLRSS